MTLKEIEKQIAAAKAAPINENGTSEYWNLLPRVAYTELPDKLKAVADKYTVEAVKNLIFEVYPVDLISNISDDQEAFNNKIAEALHKSVFLIESTDITPPQPTGNAAIDAANMTAFTPVSLIVADFLTAWEKVTGIKSEKRYLLPAAKTNNLLSQPYLPMLNDTLVNDFMQINTRSLTVDHFTRRANIFTKGGHKITIENFDKLLKALSTPAKKILNTAIIYLSKVNYYDPENFNINSLKPTVEIPLIEYGEACGYHLTPEKMATAEEQAKEDKATLNRIKEFKKDVRRNLRDISSVLWTAEVKTGRNIGDYSEMRIISSHKISKGIIRINFDVDAAAYLAQSYIMQHPTALLKIDNRNPNAYAIGFKIAQHNSNDNNVKKGTNNTLSVKSLLEAAPEIQSIEELQAKGQRNWKDKIRKPLEKSLEELVNVGVLKKWEYRDPATDGITYTTETVNDLPWAQYSRLMVDFIMVNEPDHTARLAAKKEKAAAIKEKKERARKAAI